MIYTIVPALPLLLILSLRSFTRSHLLPQEQQIREKNDDKLCRNTDMIWSVEGVNGSCHCGTDLNGIVACDEDTKELYVLDCYCMTRHRTEQGKMDTVVGSCIFNCGNMSYRGADMLYHAAPSECRDFNRQGTLCGRCFDGYALPAYSYNMKCMKCDSKFQKWWLYVIYAFLPLTVFNVIVLLFRISVVAPELYLFVSIAQIFASPLMLRVMLNYPHGYGLPVSVVYFYVTVFGVWNLDFFRVDVLPPVCFDIIPLHTLALDYFVALYPMLLMGVAYIIVELYSCGYRPLLYLWRPFHRFFARFRRTWGIQTSIMDAFVTFFVLSSTKLFTVSFAFLVGSRLFTADGQDSMYLYYDPSIKYFSTVHLPYILVAISVLFLVFIFPLSLLLCYQFRTCRKCLIKCRLNGTVLDTYVHSFQQYYKDGSNGTWDCRCFSSSFFILRIVASITYAVSVSEITCVLLIFVFITASIIFLIVRPFKEKYDLFNTLTPNGLLLLALFFVTLVRESLANTLQMYYVDNTLSSFLLTLFPLFYIIGLVVYRLYKRWCSAHFNKAFGTVAVNSLPHRILHSDQYRDSFGFIPASPSLPHMDTQ